MNKFYSKLLLILVLCCLWSSTAAAEYAHAETESVSLAARPDYLTVKKTFRGIDKLPDSFLITVEEISGGTNKVVATLRIGSAISGNGSARNPYVWKVSGLNFRKSYIVVESGANVNGYSLSGIFSSKVTPGCTAALKNIYRKNPTPPSADPNPSADPIPTADPITSPDPIPSVDPIPSPNPPEVTPDTEGSTSGDITDEETDPDEDLPQTGDRHAVAATILISIMSICVVCFAVLGFAIRKRR